MDYVEVALHVASADVSAATDAVEAEEIGGVYIEDYSDMMDCSLVRQIDLIDEELKNRDRTVAVLHLYFEPQSDWKNTMERIRRRLDAANVAFRIDVADVADDDWLNGWKKYYKPLHFGTVTVVPAWEAYSPRPGEKLLILDPGLAFGTGSHETTACCIEALESTVRPGDRVLDVGCGSGILGIAALICGAGYALGIDIDPNAARVAERNAALNPVADRFASASGDILDDGDTALRAKIGAEKYDIVVSNIVADVIIALAPRIRRFLKTGGRWISSGILSSRADEVRAALTRSGFTVAREERKKEWVCFVCE